jgi:hypothetical protein
MDGIPIELRVEMESTSILSSALLLFGVTVVLAGLAFALVIWWIARRGATEAASPATGGPPASAPRQGSSGAGIASR